MAERARPLSSYGIGIEDGADEIKAHPFFRNIDFSTLHLQTPPFVPLLANDADTRYFEDMPDDAQPLAPPGGAVDADQAKDPMLRHAEHGKDLLEIRKAKAFVG